MFRGIEIQSADLDSIPCLDGDGDIGIQGELPRLDKAILDGDIVVDPGRGDLVPALCKKSQGLAEFTGGAVGGICDGGMCSRGRAGEGMREGFVLRRGRRGRQGGGGEVGVFEIVGGEGGDVVADVGGDARDGFLDLGRVVVGLVFVDAGDPGVVSKGRETMGKKRDNFWRVERASLRASTRVSRSLYSEKDQGSRGERERGLTLGELGDVFGGDVAETLSGGLDRLGKTL